MRKTFILLLAVMFGLLTLTSHSAVNAKDEPEEPEDYFQLYRYAGRKWLLKRTPKSGNEGGDSEVTYHEFEVQNVWENKAQYTQNTLDAGKKDIPNSVFEITVDFDKDGTVFKDPIGFKKQKREKVKTEAGTFDCILWFAAATFDGDARLWRSVEFPGLVVKQDDRFGTRELEEFRWCPGESGYKGDDKGKKKKKKKGDAEPEQVDQKRLYGNKGSLWVLNTAVEKGERGYKSWDVNQYEIKKVTDEECVLEITKLSQLLEKIKGEEPVEVIIKFDDSFSEQLEPPGRSILERTEQRITEVGLFECSVYTYKDEEGRAGRVWYANEWPGLVIRRIVTGELYKAVTEIVKFEQ
ncbi:MAG: hypothetical protein K8I27_00200 [Planctomycetes bacterium]|nr:hypothetical protein [Planctomycetota bacterium]